MTNAELIKALREAKKHFWTQPQIELYPMMEAAADALEAADKRIAELEAQMPKEGECEEKKPKTVRETGYSFYCDCPTCGRRLISNVDGKWCAGSFDRFCRMCGQAIYWGKNDEQADC